MKRVRQTNHHRVEFNVRQHFFVAAEDLFRRILCGKSLAPTLIKVASCIQVPQPTFQDPFRVAFTRPAQSDDTDVVFVHTSPERKIEKRPRAKEETPGARNHTKGTEVRGGHEGFGEGLLPGVANNTPAGLVGRYELFQRD